MVGFFPRCWHSLRLNESPSKKEGKFLYAAGGGDGVGASMKAPPKRKGNRKCGAVVSGWPGPQ